MLPFCKRGFLWKLHWVTSWRQPEMIRSKMNTQNWQSIPLKFFKATLWSFLLANKLRLHSVIRDDGADFLNNHLPCPNFVSWMFFMWSSSKWYVSISRYNCKTNVEECKVNSEADINKKKNNGLHTCMLCLLWSPPVWEMTKNSTWVYDSHKYQKFLYPCLVVGDLISCCLVVHVDVTRRALLPLTVNYGNHVRSLARYKENGVI